MLRRLRHAVRSLLRSPGATLLSIAALALGIGVNISSFISIEALVLHALPYPDIDRIVRVWETSEKFQAGRDALTPPNYQDLAAQIHSFQATGAYRLSSLNLSVTGGSTPAQVCFATAGFFKALGMAARLGRTFLPDEERVAVVSESFWKRQLAETASVPGSHVVLNGATYSVIGVMPDDFDYPLATDVWTPLIFSAAEQQCRDSHQVQVIARLRPEVTLESAQSEVETFAARLRREYPVTNTGRGFSVLGLRESLDQFTGRFVTILSAAAGFVLLLACANMANIQLARAMGRRREMAIRTALGAAGWEAALMFLFEAVLIGLAAGALGMLFASWNLELTKAGIPAQVYHWVAGIKNMRIDAATYAYAALLSVAFGALCALPAIFLAKRKSQDEDVNEVLRSGKTYTSSLSREWLRGGIVVIEVAMALVLLVGAALMTQAFRHISQTDPGYDATNVLSADLAAPASRNSQFYTSVLQNVRQLPGVKTAALLHYAGTSEGVIIEGHAAPKPHDLKPGIRAVSDGYFDALRLPVIEGRIIESRDGPDAPQVAVVTQSIARFYWPNSTPVGAKIKLRPTDSQWFTVVGVCGDTRDWFGNTLEPAVYVSHQQMPGASARLLTRTNSDPMRFAPALRETINAVDSAQPAFEIKTLKQMFDEETSGVRAAARTMLMYAVIALLLAVTGIYGVYSYIVSQRAYEVGVRMAIGASRASIVKLFLQRATLTAGLGLVIGVALSWSLGRLAGGLLNGIIQLDPLLFATLTAMLAATALAAAYFPAWRAATADPRSVLES